MKRVKFVFKPYEQEAMVQHKMAHLQSRYINLQIDWSYKNVGEAPSATAENAGESKRRPPYAKIVDEVGTKTYFTGDTNLDVYHAVSSHLKHG